MDACRWSGLPGGAHDRDLTAPFGDPAMTAAFTVLGILLVIVAIPFGLLLAPLTIGVLLIWFGMRRLNGVLDPIDGPVAL